VRVRPQYVIAAIVATLAIAVTYAAVQTGNTRPKQASARQIRAMEQAALRRLKLPAGFKRIVSGCKIGQCYLTSASASEVETLIPRLMGAAGMRPVGSLRAAEPVAALRASHWSTTSRDPLVIACRPLFLPAGGHIETCQDAARIGSTLINALTRPYFACQRRVCARRTELVTWAVTFPNGV
jgi:hypothetical protein